MIKTPTIINSKNHNTSAMLLGSGELGKEIAIELSRFGIYTIACDKYDNAPAMKVADKALVFDMQDEEALKNAICEHKPDYIIPEIEAINTKLLVKLEQELNLNVIPNAKSADITMNRETIRDLASNQLKLPTSKFFFAKTYQELLDKIDTIGFPCILKPTMSSSGKGQSMVKEQSQLEGAWNYAINNARGNANSIIVESVVDFDYEITLLTISAVNGIFFCEPIGHRQEDGDYRESWQPARMSNKALTKAQEIAKSIVLKLGGYGIFGVELFIKGDEVIFSEISPRPHDTGMVTLISQNFSEFALHVRALLGLPIGEIIQYSPAASAAVLATGYGDSISYSDLDKALSISDKSDIKIFGKPNINGKRRLALCLCRADNIDDAIENVCKMSKCINIEVK